MSGMYLQYRVGSIAAVSLNAEDEIPSPSAAHRLHKPPAGTIPSLSRSRSEGRDMGKGGAKTYRR